MSSFLKTNTMTKDEKIKKLEKKVSQLKGESKILIEKLHILKAEAMHYRNMARYFRRELVMKGWQEEKNIGQLD